MGTRTITGTFPSYPVATVTFALEALFVDSGAIYPVFSTSVVTDGEGDFSVSLPVPTSDAAAYVVALPGNKRNVHFTLGAGASIGLDVILASVSTTMSVDAIQELLADYQADVTAQIAAAATATTTQVTDYQDDTAAQVTAYEADVTAQVAALAAALALRVPLLAWYWDSDYDEAFAAPEAMTISAGMERGTGTLTYAKALSATPTVFTTVTLPVTLAAGDVLRITATGVTVSKSLTLRRTV